MSYKIKDITNKRFGRLVAVKPTNIRKSGSVVWLFKCDCGKEKEIKNCNVTSGHTKSCGCFNTETSIINGKLNRRGTKNITGVHWGRIKRHARERGYEFKIIIEYIQNLIELQNFKCALSGLPLILNIENTFRLTGKYNLNTASLDRIDSSKGYIEGNVQWVHKDINYMKQDLNETYFYNMCKNVVNNMEKRGVCNVI